MCKQLGNCVLLTIDLHFPENNKKKKRLITKLRTYCNDHQIHYLKEVIEKTKEPSEREIENIPTIRLTIIDKLFIENLKQKR